MRHFALAVGLIAIASMPVVAVAQQTEAERRAEELAREADRRRADEADAAARERLDASLAQQRQWSAEASEAQAGNRREIEAIRAQVLKQPPLLPAKNPLLGRWVMITKGPSTPENLTDLVVNMQANMETLACAMIFGEDEFEYRPDALVLPGPDGKDGVADKIAYRAGKGGSVFAVGTNLIRLLHFDFDAGPDRMRNGKCVYQKVKARAAAPPAAPATSAAIPAAPTVPTSRARTYAGAGFKVAGVTLGVDGTPAVHQDVAARGGTLLGPLRGRIGPMVFFGRDAGYKDVSADAYAVAYDFDNEDPSVARLVAVTLYCRLDKALIAARAAALADWNPTLVRPGRLEGRKGDVWLVLEELPADGSVGETYLLK